MLDHVCVVATSKIDPLETPIPKHVILTSAVQPAVGHAIMRGAAILLDVFLDTDRSCGPSVIVDALAMGLPVVTTDTNAARDYVIHGVTGLLSPPGDAVQLADNIKALLGDPALRKQMGNSAREFAMTSLSRATFESKLASFL
jgi:glycosyltransferase involved in cell wall biosynthesis